MLRGVRVLVDGRPVTRRRDRGRPYWPITFADGEERSLYVTGTVTGLRAVTADEEIPLERRLAWWELLLAFLPLGLITIGGLIGGVAGGAGMVAALWAMRRPWPTAARVTAALAALAFSVAGWLVLRELVIAAFYSG